MKIRPKPRNNSENSKPQETVSKEQIATQINARDSRGNTSLHRAAQANDPASVSALVKLGADPNIVNNRGLTPGYIACCENANKLSALAMKQGGAIVNERMLVEMKRQAQAEPLNREKREIRTIFGVN